MRTLYELLQSKKAVMAILAIIVWIAGRAGFDVDADTLYGVIAPLLAFIVSQGIADHGKERAKIETMALSAADERAELRDTIAAVSAEVRAIGDRLAEEPARATTVVGEVTAEPLPPPPRPSAPMAPASSNSNSEI